MGVFLLGILICKPQRLPLVYITATEFMKTYCISQHRCQEWRPTSELSFQDQRPKGCRRAGLVRSAGPLQGHRSVLPHGRKLRLEVPATPKPEAAAVSTAERDGIAFSRPSVPGGGLILNASGWWP